MDDYIRTTMAASEPQRHERAGMDLGRVPVATPQGRAARAAGPGPAAGIYHPGPEPRLTVY